MDKAKLRMAAALSVAVGVTAAGAGGASAAAPAAPPAARSADLLPPTPNAVERLTPADAREAGRAASQPRLIKTRQASPPDQYYPPQAGYWVRDQYGRYYYYDPYRQPPYAYPPPNAGYLYRDQYGRYYYYNPYGEAPYG